MIELIVFCILALQFPKVEASPACDGAIEQLSRNEDSINKKIKDLAALRLNLDLAKIEGKGFVEDTALADNYKRKEKSVIEYLEDNKIMTRAQFIERLRQEISTLQAQDSTEQVATEKSRRDSEDRKKKQETEIKMTVIDGSFAKFHRIAPGSFKMGPIKFGMTAKERVDVEISKSFEMMATLITQRFYREVVELSDAKFPGRYQLKSRPSKFVGDLKPVESISCQDIQVWIDALNALSESGEPRLNDLISGHKKGDYYRLPSEAEWEFVVTNRGQIDDAYYFGNDVNKLREHAWYIDNSKGETHNVAEKKPLLVGESEFYDMLGNVWELMFDGYKDILPGGVDPVVFGNRNLRAVRGGSWGFSTDYLKSFYRNTTNREDKLPHLGFRLVRRVQ